MAGRHLFDAAEDGAEEIGAGDGLDEVAGDSELAAAGGIVGEIDRGEHHDDGAKRGSSGADAGCDIEARHAGHLGIEEDEVEGGMVERGGLEMAEGIEAGGDGDGGEAPGGEEALEDDAVGGVVIDDERAETGEAMRGGGFGGDGFEGAAEAGGEMEAAAASEGTFGPDIALHEADELGGDGEAESGAAVAPGEGSVDLDERLEDGIEFGGGDAAAGIGDGEVEDGCVGWTCFEGDLDADLS